MAQVKAPTPLGLSPVAIALHLLLQGADRRIDGSELPFDAVTPEAQHPQLALLVATKSRRTVTRVAAAAKGGEHGKLGKAPRF